MKTDMYFSNLDAANVTSPSLAEVTVQRILHWICEGKLQESQLFPSQSQLAEWFGVSRTVIREATQVLISKGVLNVQHGKRTVIRPPSYEHISESVNLTFRRKGISVLDVLELRKVIEVEAAALAAERAAAEDTKAMSEAIHHMERNIEHETGYVDADVAFHNALFKASRQPAFELVLFSLNDYLITSRKISYQGLIRTKRALEEHKIILQYIIDRDSENARLAMRKHLDETEKDFKRIWYE